MGVIGISDPSHGQGKIDNDDLQPLKIEENNEYKIKNAAYGKGNEIIMVLDNTTNEEYKLIFSIMKKNCGINELSKEYKNKLIQ